jgi:hypothetical protein
MSCKFIAENATQHIFLTFPFLTKEPSKLAKCQSVIDVKILVIVVSSNSSIEISTYHYQ